MISPLTVSLLLMACTGADTGAVDVNLTVEDHPDMPLGVLAQVETDTTCAVSIDYDGGGLGVRSTPWTSPATDHRIPVLGLRAETSWTLTAWADCGDVLSGSDPQTHETGALVLDVPAFRVDVPQPDAVGTGLTLLVPVVRGTTEPPVFVALDADGEVVWAWQDPDGDTSHADPFAALADDGSLVVVQHDSVQGLSWEGQVLWSVSGATAGVGALHHDAIVLDDGSVLALTEEIQEHTVEGALRDVVADRIVQLSADGALLWSWSPFDHLDLSDLTADQAQDWIHGNALLSRDGQILLSSRSLDQLIAIDHASGEVDWILGVGGDFSLTEGDWFDGQHAPEWHDDGTLVLYDNGGDRVTSRAVVYAVDESARTLNQQWTWQTDAYTPRLGDADRINGDQVLVTAGGPEGRDAPAVISQVDADGEVVWQLSVADSAVYRAIRIPSPWED